MTTQLDCSVGLAPESTYSTAVTVTRFPEFVDESFDWQPTFVQGVGLRVGSRLARSGRRKLGKSMAAGDLSIEANTKGLGMIWKACLGVGTSTQIAAGPGYQQVFTPTVSDYLPSYTIQKGIPPLGGGATIAHTFSGCTVSSFALSVATGGILELKVNWDIKQVDTAAAYAAPSYPTPESELFTFKDGAITIGGSVTVPTATALATGGTAVANITDWSLNWDNKLDNGGFTFGSAGMKRRAPAVGLAAGTGKITAEFDSVTLRDAYLNQSDLAMVMTFQSTVAIASGVYPTVQIVIPEIRLDGELPKAASGGVVTQAIGYTVLDGLTAASPLYIVAVTADTAL